MATSSITKTFKIKDKQAMDRYVEILQQPAIPLDEKKSSSLEEGKTLADKYYDAAKKQANDDAEVIARRMQDVESGKSKLIPTAEFHAKLREIRERV